MASVRQLKNGKFELQLTNKLLPKGRVYFTFDDEGEARTYGEACEKWLAKGIVPGELAAPRAVQASELFGPILRAWLDSGEPSATDQEILRGLRAYLSKLQLSTLTYEWAEGWVRSMKLDQVLAPGSIRKRVQAVSRVIDWHLRKTPGAMVGNPLKLLPRGYSAYNAKDAQLLEAVGKAPRVDVQRDRRLVPASGDHPSEEQRILQALAGVPRPDRERPLNNPDAPALRMLFLLNVWAGLRLREGYTLYRRQINLASRVIRARCSKQWHGREKWRDVPIRAELLPELETYLATLPDDPDALVFPWWDGDPATLANTTNKLSKRFTTLFDYAGVPNFTEHDLRHEATCRWLELRSPDGGWMFRDEEINTIMGWEPGSEMAGRYASFRAEDLAARLHQEPRRGQFELGREDALRLAPPQTDATVGSPAHAEYLAGYAQGLRDRQDEMARAA